MLNSNGLCWFVNVVSAQILWKYQGASNPKVLTKLVFELCRLRSRRRHGIVPDEFCPHCWGGWGFKFKHNTCPECAYELGEQVNHLLDTDTWTAPWPNATSNEPNNCWHPPPDLIQSHKSPGWSWAKFHMGNFQVKRLCGGYDGLEEDYLDAVKDRSMLLSCRRWLQRCHECLGLNCADSMNRGDL